ncbi:gamma-glutamyl-gamma-aminobutyrate hydrolase PuuD [Paraburkholderia bannensis]|uniref:Gamma-glutamyl-gamma-aminobutyrate hydrolase PuuD n=1 Tax=Paraburkholderia bannensis TaxID=765414 RepID=A0A7W9TS22_9BURK|nr:MULTISPECIES: type 1 glutamine amidotransferase [Paraburkholderia]MBB3255562.1 gamma-glutamyl-gamma-aminobutyrate hydrolase PuuD [Paraburkholderia sp. WP4_3_2]MBB6100427.1 gamma-glutamyl-gamma-aminobutyrate hydrolase PuuD [Paraburkholderia bannensis]
MSDNKTDRPEVPDGAGRPAGSSESTRSTDSTDSGTAPSSSASSTPSAGQATGSGESAQRASTDAPDSASNVTSGSAGADSSGGGIDEEPVASKAAPSAASVASAGAAAATEAAQAREEAGRAVERQAAEAAARAAATGAGKPQVPIEVAADADRDVPAPTASEAKPAAPEAAAQAKPPQTGGATRPGAAPAGFGQAPDFTAQNPPPPGALPPEAPRYLRPSDSAWSVLGRIIAARARQLFDRAGQRITQRTLRIGVSARIFHPEPGAQGLRGKTLQYLEESIAHWVMSRDVIVFMIPTVGHQGMLHPSNIRLRDYAKHLDGLLLQGGADVSPQTYAEVSPRPEWPGDRVRDMYELELLHEFVESGKPVLGVCRGCQLINVAFGGTLYQDIASDVPTAGVHVSEHYDQHRHAITFPEGSSLASMFPGRREAIVNSIHHQAVKTLGRDLTVEAVSAGDGLIEAVRYRRAPFVVGVQWHPEFHRAGGPELLDCTPLLDNFLRSARETRF